MNKRKKRAGMVAAQKIVDALKSSGIITNGAEVEIRVCGHKQPRNKKQTKPQRMKHR